MFASRPCIPLAILAAILLAADGARAMDSVFVESDETKERLKLEYDVSVADHGTGRVTIVLAIANQGHLKPLDGVDLVIPGKERSSDGGSYVDLSVALAIQEQGGKQIVRVHILKELAQRAEIQLRTRHLDGKQGVLGGWRYSIPIAKHLNETEKKQ